MGDKVYETVIPRNVRVSEAPSHGKPVLLYDLKCAGSQAYLRLASEVIQRERRAAARPRDPEMETTMADEAARRSRLGRGLAALIGDVGDEAGVVERARGAAARPDRVPAAATRATRARPSREDELDELADSIREKRHHPADRGAAAARACRTPTRSSPASGAGARPSGPACTTCRSSSSRPTTATALELAIIENVQRADLNAARRGGRLRAAGRASSATRQDDLGDDPRQEPQPRRQHAAAAEAARRRCRTIVPTGELTAGHARALLSVQDPEAVRAGSSRRG